MLYNLWEFIKPWVCWYRCVRHQHEDTVVLAVRHSNGGTLYTLVCVRCGRKRTLWAHPPIYRKRNRRH